jgi:acyl-ACP thioesterase
MPNEPAAVELLERPSSDRETARVFELRGRVRLGDVDRLGRLRLDSTARWLQDAATDDAADAGLSRAYGWLVRRTMIDTIRPAMLGETVKVATWCTGIGRSWAERRSQITGDRGALIDAVSLWVQIDVATGRPARISSDFLDAYQATAGTRAVSARLHLGLPDGDQPVERINWKIRRTDVDPFGHVNNAATWAYLEECAALDDDECSRIGRAEMEYLQPVEHGRATKAVLRRSASTLDAWLEQDGAVCAAARWALSHGGCPTPSGVSAGSR